MIFFFVYLNFGSFKKREKEVILQHVTLIFFVLEITKHKLFTYNFQYHSGRSYNNSMGVITRTPYFKKKFKNIKNLVNLLLHDKLPNL